MASKGAYVLVGSGPGIGRSTALTFAEKGFKHIFLLSRTKSKLEEDASYIKSKVSGTEVSIQTIDMSGDEASITKSLSELDSLLEKAGVPLEVFHYNAARVAPSKVLEYDAKEFVGDLQITMVNLYVALKWAIPKLLEAGKGSYNPAFLNTSGGLYKDPEHFLFSLSASKAGQYNLVESFHKKYEPQIHVAQISVRGIVSENAKVTTPKAIGEQFYKFYEQKKGTQGQLSVEMDDPDYKRQVKEMAESLGQA